MRRRSFLAGLTGVLAATAGPARAHPKSHPSATDDGTPPEGSDAPDPLGELPLAGAKEAVVSADGGTAYLATTDGFAVVDLADPADPALVVESEVLDDHSDGPMRQVWDVHLDDDRLLVVGPANPSDAAVNGAAVYDVSDRSSPERVAAHVTDYPIHNACLADGVAYLTANGAEGNPLVTVDAESGTEIGRWSLFDRDDAWRDVDPNLRVLHDVRVDGDLAYLAHWDAGTWILDVSDPERPEVVSRVRGRAADELAAVDDPGEESTTLPGNDHFATVDDAGDVLGVGLESWAVEDDLGNGPGGIRLYDVSEPTDPAELASIPAPPTPDPTRGGVWTTAHNFDLAEGRLYASWYQGGVDVYDLADPADPRELYHWRDAARAKFWTAQLGVSGDFFVASSWEAPGDEDAPGGLFTFPDPPDPTPTETAAEEGADGDGGDDADSIGAGGDRLLGVGTLGVGLGAGALGYRAWRRRR